MLPFSFFSFPFEFSALCPAPYRTGGSRYRSTCPAGVALPGDKVLVVSEARNPADHDKVAFFEGLDSIWIPGNDEYYMKKPAPNYLAIVTEQIFGEYALKAPSAILLS